MINFFSIVIPLYNKEQSVANSINSVLSQNFKDFELIIVDDGSTDNSVGVVNNLLKSADCKWRLIRKENAGVAAARNVGIKSAIGKYIAFLDADDIWDESYLEYIHELVLEYPDAGIYGVSWSYSMQGTRISPTSVDGVYARGYNINYWKNPFGYSSSSTVVDKTVFREVGLFDERIKLGEDLDMWYRILLSYKGAYYKRVLAYYVQDSENRMFLRQYPLEENIVCYFDKWEEWRKANKDFRIYFDRLMAPRLFPYIDALLSHTHTSHQIKIIKIRDAFDKSVLPIKFLIRLYFPYGYLFYKKIKNKLYQ